MKKIIFSFIVLVAFSCDTENRNFYNTVYFTSPTPIIQVEVPIIPINANDFIYVNTDDFDNILIEPGQSTPLNIFKTTHSPFMRFFFTLEKNVNGEWTTVVLNVNDLIVDKGEANLTTSINVAAKYNSLSDSFESRIGIRLTSQGQYRLFFQPSLQTSGHLQMASDLMKGTTAVVVSSTLLNGQGNVFNFSVL